MRKRQPLSRPVLLDYLYECNLIFFCISIFEFKASVIALKRELMITLNKKNLQPNVTQAIFRLKNKHICVLRTDFTNIFEEKWPE